MNFLAHVNLDTIICIGAFVIHDYEPTNVNEPTFLILILVTIFIFLRTIIKLQIHLIHKCYFETTSISPKTNDIFLGEIDTFSEDNNLVFTQIIIQCPSSHVQHAHI
jgi:hypothetical protein